MKISAIVIACLGIGLLFLGAVLAWSSTSAYRQAPEFAWSTSGLYFEWTGLGYLGGFAAGFLGSVLALIGGFARTPYLWIGMILGALVYCIPFLIGGLYVYNKELQYPTLHPNPGEALGTLWWMAPGLATLLEGTVLAVLDSKRSKEQHL
jgi:hypothetical protein